MTHQTMRPGVTQTIAFDSSAAVANAFGGQTFKVRLVANAPCNFKIDTTPTATASDPYLPANWETFVTVTPGQKIAAIKSPTNGLVTATAGTLYVTELA